MPAPTPPGSHPLTPDTPDRLEGQDTFNTKAFTWNDWFSPFSDWTDTVVTYFNNSITYVEGLLATVASLTSSALASKTAAELAETNAEAAAAAAQAAAGLTPDPDFGMVIATTASTVVKTATYTAEIGKIQDVDTSAGAFAIALPASPQIGWWFGVRDINQNSFAGKYPWLDYVSDKIIGLSEDHFIDVNTAIYTYRGVAKGWCL